MPVSQGYKWWGRQRVGEKSFRYLSVRERPLADARAIQRIERLAIPPAWTNVHISPDPARRVQAFGFDDAGRKQYIYSSAAVLERDRKRWNRVIQYGRVLPRLRQITNDHLARDEVDRARVLATVVRLIARAFFRIGSERYATQNRTFGIATLYKRHLVIDGDNLIFRYVGKQKKQIRRVVADTPLVEIMHQILELPGRRLFRYRENGGVRNVTAPAVNEYLREICGDVYTAKDLRTFGGTVRAATILADLGPAASPKEARRNVVLTTRLVGAELGNTPAIARAAYIHPAVLEQYEEHGRVIDAPHHPPPNGRGRARHRPAARRPRLRAHDPSYYPEEAALLRFLERYGTGS